MRGIRLIVVLAIMWVAGGWLMGISLRVLYGVNWIPGCASLSLLLGMLLLLFITRNPREHEILFEGAEREENEQSLAALLVAIPFVLIFIALVWMILAPFIK